jgi:hypothetical protein
MQKLPDPPPPVVVVDGDWVVTGALVGPAVVGALVGPAVVGALVTGWLVDGGFTGPPPPASSSIFFIKEINGYFPSPQIVPVKSSRARDHVIAPPYPSLIMRSVI